MHKRVLATFILLAGLALWARPVMAGEFHCEVLNIKGTVTVRDLEDKARPAKKAELLKVGETLEIGDESYADLSYDKDWKNIVRVEANTKLKIISIAPGRVDVSQGGVFAKLKKLPEDSSFEVRTPTAVATVRGSEYRTTFLLGQTDVFNAASSRIVVYGVKEDGSVDKDTAVMVEKDKKTSVETAGKAPKPAEPMSESEIKTGKSLQSGIETNVTAAEKEGRSGNIQSVTDIEEHIREEKKKAAAAVPPKEDELSRVTDTRRRPFGGDNEMAPPPAEEEKEQPPAKEEPAKEEPASAENA